MKKVFIFILIFAVLPAAYGDEILSKSDIRNAPDLRPHSILKNAKGLLDAGEYSQALENLKTSYQELPVIRDYTLFFMASAYNKMNRLEDSDNCIDELLKAYPDSLLRKRAKALKIKNITAKSEDPKNINSEAIKYLEQYVIEYPEDAETMFMFGQVLKSRGETGRAHKLFRQVYIANNSYSEPAYKELQPSLITSDDLLAKASNYMKALEYKEAESVLRNSLPAADTSIRDDMQRLLASSLFRQKKYKEASNEYLKSGDIYNAARSFYRNGDMDSFNRMVSKLISAEDRRAGSLLIAYASYQRREGKTEEALKIYHDTGKKYPLLTEDALWGIAWTYYRNRDCQSSLKILKELNGTHGSSKYIYWKQRCIEQDRLVSSEMKDKIAVADNEEKNSHKPYAEGQKKKEIKTDFYSLLLSLHDIEKLLRPAASQASWTPVNDSSQKRSNNATPSEIFPCIERFNILSELNMKEDAVNELIYILRKASRPEVVIYISYKLQEVGAYKKSISIASKIPADGNDIDRILYPLAYWQTVSEVSRQHALDPFILLSVIREESRFDPDARSVAGALGLMQIMPQTAYSLDKKLNMNIPDSNEILDIRTNIAIGAYYLSSLLKEFGSLPVALAAYNAGEEKVREWLKAGDYKSSDEFIEDIPYNETRNYVKSILLSYAVYLEMNNRLQK